MIRLGIAFAYVGTSIVKTGKDSSWNIGRIGVFSKTELGTTDGRQHVVWCLKINHTHQPARPDLHLGLQYEK